MRKNNIFLSPKHNIIYYNTNKNISSLLETLALHACLDKNLDKKQDFYFISKKTFIKQEKNLNKNRCFDKSLSNYKEYSMYKQLVLNRKNFIFLHLDISSFILKNLYLNQLKIQKQYLYFLEEYSNILNKTILKLWALEINLVLKTNSNFIFIAKKIIKNEHILLARCLNTFFSQKTLKAKNIENFKGIAFVYNKISKILQRYIINAFFLHQYNIINKNYLKLNISQITLNSKLLAFVLLLETVQKTQNLKIKNPNFRNIINHKYLSSILKNKTHIDIFSNLLIKFKPIKKNIRALIWKKNNLSIKNYIYYDIIKKRNFFSRHKILRRNVYNSYVYIINKIEEKIVFLRKSNKTTTILEKLRSLLILKWKNKIHRQKGNSILLSTVREIRKIRTFKWKKYFKHILLNKIQKVRNTNILFKKFLNKILFLEKKINPSSKTSVENGKYNKFKILPYWRKTLKIRIPFKNKRIILKNDFKEYLNYKHALSLLTNRNVSIFYINAVSLGRFAFKLENTTKNSKAFLENVERELINRYKYVATYIQDLVQISFISLFFKKPTFLTKFIAFQIEKLPRNRKETKLIKFIIKTVKIFAAQRKETLGIRLKFKGRVNRWRRTKAIIGDRGTINLHTHSERIEFGSAKAVTRKGTLGISFWIRYSPYFQNEIEKTIKQYVKYSKLLYAKKLKRFFFLYNNQKQLYK